jgi:hypothetical protein
MIFRPLHTAPLSFMPRTLHIPECNALGTRRGAYAVRCGQHANYVRAHDHHTRALGNDGDLGDGLLREDLAD